MRTGKEVADCLYGTVSSHKEDVLYLRWLTWFCFTVNNVLFGVPLSHTTDINYWTKTDHILGIFLINQFMLR